ncbi:hypothetical protein A6J71_00055 [Enterobacter cancerogenus]|nr:hypothetical protein A6J71_00055 [Enterobacter cancerogenus]
MAWPHTDNSHASTPTSMNDKMSLILRTVTQAGSVGVTTRDISDSCDMSIYAARNWLLKLEDEGYVLHVDISKRKTYWYVK